MLLCITIPRSDRNGGGDAYKENVTSEQHTHTCRKDKETDKAASCGVLRVRNAEKEERPLVCIHLSI